MIELLRAPIDALVSDLGTGELPPDSPADCLCRDSGMLADVADTAADVVARVDRVWSGPASEAAAVLVGRGVDAAVALAAHADDLRTTLLAAGDIVARGHAELVAIARSFVACAVASLPVLSTPGGQAAVIAIALDHLERAAAVHARVRAELDEQTRTLAALVPPPVPAVAAVSTGLLGSVDPSDDHAPAGTGVAVTLPDGSTATAPNERAAAAVRFALDQQGTPYVWGGTTPGAGLDCSGLTQGAYHHAGVDIPRLAADQSVGAPVEASDVMPGDLAVWDGHVAMVVGNGQLVEAGDPVSVGPIRTVNAGMGFHGFYRPTA